jgi:protein-tyrosine phosphatase
LEAQEIAELGLGDEPRLCSVHGIDFISFPIPDRGVSTSHGALNQLVLPLVPKVKSGHMIAVHCRAGIGRCGSTSSLDAADMYGLNLELFIFRCQICRSIQLPGGQ